jgi:hypothetical protein
MPSQSGRVRMRGMRVGTPSFRAVIEMFADLFRNVRRRAYAALRHGCASPSAAALGYLCLAPAALQ